MLQRHKQRLKLLVTVLLARYRDLLPTVAARVPHAQFAAELISLPSGLLAMVSAAMVKLKVLLGHACVRARACRLGGPTRSRRAPRLSEYWGQCSPLAVFRAYAEYYWCFYY